MDMIILDLQTTYIPFTIQCTDGEGTKTDPSLAKLVIYEENGKDSTFTNDYVDNTAKVGSAIIGTSTIGTPDATTSDYVDNAGKVGSAIIGTSTIGTPDATYTPTKINSKTGFYGEMIPKSIFTAGKNYVFLWELTIDSIVTAFSETFFMINTSSFKPS